MIDALKQELLEAVKNAIEAAYGETEMPGLELGLPPDIKFGDLGLTAFPLAKVLRKSPALIARAIAEGLRHDTLEKVDAAGPYLNFTLKTPALFETVIESVGAPDRVFGFSSKHKGEKVMVEFSSPNTNKPLHIGHVRNIVLGWSVCRLLEAVGYEVIKACLVNDRGVHICKSMLAYERFFAGQTPESRNQKGDHFIGDCYVAFGNALAKERAGLAARFEAEGLKGDALEARIRDESTLIQETMEMLRRWEDGDPDTRALWKQLNDWVYEGFERTYRDLGVAFDRYYYESEVYQKGKELVMSALEKGLVFRHEDGSIRIDLAEKGLDTKVLLRSDGTSLYITQDIALGVRKWKDCQPDRSIYVIGNEQNYQMRTVFATLEKMGYAWASNLYHLSYGMVYLPEGRMKSREGKVVDADDLMAEMCKAAKEKAIDSLTRDSRRSPDDLSESELQERARTVALGAIKHYMLRVNPKKDFTFNPEESIQLTGDTGPYVQYTHARIKSILRKAAAEDLDPAQAGAQGGYEALGNPDERNIARYLLDFPRVVSDAADHLLPSTLASYLCELSAITNRFYHHHSVLGAEDRATKLGRLALSEATATVLARGLDLLGIEAPEAM